jgi:hypothetical protein
MVRFRIKIINMKRLRKHLKPIALLLAVIFLVSSCRVYHSGLVSVDEAVTSSKRVKVKSYDDEIYRFKKLEINKGKLYGVATRNSDAAHYLSPYIIDQTNDDKYVGILIPDEFISKIQVQNKGLSTVLTVLIPVIAIGGFLTLTARNMSLDLGLTLP